VLLLAEPCACGSAETFWLVRDEFLAALPSTTRWQRARACRWPPFPPSGSCCWKTAIACVTRCWPLCGANGARSSDFAATSLHTLIQMVAGGLGVTMVPRLAVAAGITAGADVELRTLEGAGGWRSIALAWRPPAPAPRNTGRWRR
jgi:LysR family hydrogen peroxide-inducible transcriptional activator